MTITVQDLSELAEADVQQKYALVKQLLQELYPNLDMRRGVFADLVLLPSSQHATALAEEIDRVQRSSSLLAISEDPTLADDDIVDNDRLQRWFRRQPGPDRRTTIYEGAHHTLEFESDPSAYLGDLLKWVAAETR